MLCHFVAEQLTNGLDISYTSLTPTDCLAIGYFVSSVSLTFTSSKSKKFRVYLSNCSLGDAGTKSLMNSISRHIDQYSTVNTYLDLNLSRNNIQEKGASYIADQLNSNRMVSMLWLHGNPIGDKGLQNIFNALKPNKTLKRLDISYCNMTDTGVDSLATALNVNYTLETIYIFGNDAMTNNGLARLVEVLSRNPLTRLVALWISSHFGVDQVEKTINEARQIRGLAAIKVYGK